MSELLPRTPRTMTGPGVLRRVPRLTDRSGTTFIELMVVITILVVAVSIFSRIVVATSRLRETNRENAIAGEAARVLVEHMRGADYTQIFALYNSDPNDDPGGRGTAPGDRFEVPGLEPLDDSPDGLIGQIIFPTPQSSLTALPLDQEEEEEDECDPREEPGGEGAPAGGGGKNPPEKFPMGAALVPMAIGTAPQLVNSPLREDCDYPLLGMPRDLNGDSIIDTRDHGPDYLILPVQIRIEWEGRHGPRVMDLFTMLTRFKKDG